MLRRNNPIYLPRKMPEGPTAEDGQGVTSPGPAAKHRSRLMCCKSPKRCRDFSTSNTSSSEANQLTSNSCPCAKTAPRAAGASERLRSPPARRQRFYQHTFWIAALQGRRGIPPAKGPKRSLSQHNRPPAAPRCPGTAQECKIIEVQALKGGKTTLQALIRACACTDVPLV